MLVTNDEARQMYCPFKFSQSGNREAGRINPERACEGLKCMAWQRSQNPVRGDGGYCGLAGKPEGGI